MAPSTGVHTTGEESTLAAPAQRLLEPCCIHGRLSVASSIDDRGSNTPDFALARTLPLSLHAPPVNDDSPDLAPAAAPPPSPDPQEAAAIVRVQAGDTAAFDLLVRRYMRSAYAVAYR